MITQSDTERVIDELLNSLGSKVEGTVELTRFTAYNDKVVSTLRHADGAEEIAETSWLIGCDGAHSAITPQPSAARPRPAPLRRRRLNVGGAAREECVIRSPLLAAVASG